MNNKLAPIPAWFWEMIESAKPELRELEARLESLDREQLENYYGLYRTASQELCESWNGPYVGDELGYLSEDSTEDLCDWIVSQGFVYWSSIASMTGEVKEAALREAFEQEYRLSQGHSHPKLVDWNYAVSNPAYEGSQSPCYLPMAIYGRKFEEKLLDREEEILDRVDKLLDGKA